jgi:hypothetical protein
MSDRYRARVALTSLALILALAGGTPTPRLQGSCPPDLRQWYAPRVLRRMRTTLQLRILEARRRRLALARDAILRQATIDQLLAQPEDAAILNLKHLRSAGTSNCL